MAERTLGLIESMKILGKYGVRFAPSGLAKDADQALFLANNMGYPVVLKIVSPGISHKTDVGGVVAGIRDDNSLHSAFKKIILSAKKKSPHVKIDGVLVQKMVEGGVEVLIGGKRDPQFGQAVAFGLGGVFVEVMQDVSFRLAPIEKKDALEMMAETKGFKVIDGYRGKSYDKESVAVLISKVSKMLDRRNDIVELDMNPVIVLKDGAVAVDARIVVDG